jgi:Flp pilus assembly protein TadB
MPPTKRKRRSKHRGTAAGTVEARGRTGRKPTQADQKKTSGQDRRQARLDREPSWNSSALRAGFASLLLFVIMQTGLLGERIPLGQSLVVCVFALLVYVPLGYFFDRAIYNRRMRRKAEQQRAKGGR